MTRYQHMAKLRFKPISHSWVALHPQPKGVIQFLGGAFFGTFAPMLFYRHLLRYFFDKSYTIVILPFSFSFNHYREAVFLLKEQYALVPELVSRAIAEGADPEVYLKADNYIWLGHSIGCKYIALLESAGKLPAEEEALVQYLTEILEQKHPDAAHEKFIRGIAQQLMDLRRGLVTEAMASKKLVSRCEGKQGNLVEDSASDPKFIYNDLFIRDQISVLLAPVNSDTSSAIRIGALAKWIDDRGWGVQPTPADTRNLIKKADLFHLLVLAAFQSDKLAQETVGWFYKCLDRPDCSERKPFEGAHFRPMGFSLGDLVINPWFDRPLITSTASRDHQLESQLDAQLQTLRREIDLG